MLDERGVREQQPKYVSNSSDVNGSPCTYNSREVEFGVVGVMDDAACDVFSSQKRKSKIEASVLCACAFVSWVCLLKRRGKLMRSSTRIFFLGARSRGTIMLFVCVVWLMGF